MAAVLGRQRSTPVWSSESGPAGANAQAVGALGDRDSGQQPAAAGVERAHLAFLGSGTPTIGAGEFSPGVDAGVGAD
jgi:hypothetical protein